MDRQFNSEDVIKILRNKFVIIIGDSNIMNLVHRSIYKDIVLLVQKDRYLTRDELKSKGELSFLDDELIEGGRKDGLSNGINYKEMRQYKTEKHHVRFYFVTRCYNTYVKSILLDLQDEPHPDIVVMNSCVWDVSRYGKDSVPEYKRNLQSLFCDLNTILPRDCIMIWNTTLPVSKYARGGFLPAEEDFQHSVLSADIKEANVYTKHIADSFNISILDLHARLLDHGELQVQDGIHWDMIAHRFITNLIMEMVCDHFGSHVPWRPPQLCVHRHPPKLNSETSLALNFPSQNMFIGDTPISALQRRGRRSRANRRRKILNSSQNSSDFQSPYTDYSFNDFQSPFAHYSPNNNSFQSPHFFQTLTELQNLISSQLDFSHSPRNPTPNFFGFDSPMSFNNPNYFQNSSVEHSPHYLDFENNRPIQIQNNFICPNVNENLRRMANSASNFNGWQFGSPYPPSYQCQSYQQPLREVGNGFFNLGQYSEQSGQSGAMRHHARRRHQPYKDSHRR